MEKQHTINGVYRHVAATWPFQVRKAELGDLITRYDDSVEKLIALGRVGIDAHETAMKYLRSQVGMIDWAPLSRTKRKIAWLQLCSRFIPSLKRTVEKAEKQKAKQDAAVTDRASKSSGRSEVAVARDLSAQKRIQKTRLGALLKSRARSAEKPGVRTFLFTPRTTRRMIRFERSSKKPARRVESSKRVPERPESESHTGQTYLTPTERRQRHVDRQKFRSRRRIRQYSARMAWVRNNQERESAGADLWQQQQAPEDQVHDESAGSDLGQQQQSLEDRVVRTPRKDLSAWPRLEARQRRILAEDVEAFVRRSR